MLKLSEIRFAYEESTKTLSELNRQLCFAGFAIIWIFNGGNINEFKVPEELFIPGFLLSLSLFTDVLQYITSTLIWYLYYLRQRKNYKDRDEDAVNVIEPEYANWPAWLLFVFKILFMLTAYVLIGLFLISKF